MSKTKKILPELRFPEFTNTEGWDAKTLGEVAERIEEKVNNKKLTTASISAGTGFVSQAEKFSRDISGAQYKNYIVLNEGEFSYNKGNSKRFPQGCIYKLKEFKQVAVPNAFISFRFKPNFIGDFYQGYFDNNFHGVQLMRFITSGARMDGLLNIKADDFFSIVLPTPSKSEQQKIASCLSSLDDLIEVHNEKLDLLKDHKKGLIQNLFPQGNEKVPKYRFKEFVKDREWKKTTIDEVAKVSTGGTPDSTNPEYWNGDIPWMNSGELNNKRINSVSTFITYKGLKASSTKLIPPLCILIGLAGQGKTRGTAAINYIELCTNQSIASVHPNEDVFDSEFLFQSIDSMYDKLRYLSSGDGGRGGLNLQIIKEIELFLPKMKEQQKIASCLSSLDEIITAQAEIISQLKLHKKGLLQRLFPKAID